MFTGTGVYQPSTANSQFPTPNHPAAHHHAIVSAPCSTERAAGFDHPEQVYVERFPEGILGNREELVILVEEDGVVHQHVYAAEMVHHLLVRRVDASAIGDVEVDGDRIAREIVECEARTLDSVNIPAGHRHAKASREQLPGRLQRVGLTVCCEPR